MSTVPPTHPKPRPDAPLTGRPSTRSLLRWGALVLVLHLFFLLGLAGTLDWQLSSPQTLRTGPMQTRTMVASEIAPTSTQLRPTPAARTRVALVEQPKPAPAPKPLTPQTAAAPEKAPTDKPTPTAGSPAPEQALDPGQATTANLAGPDPVSAQSTATQTDTEDRAEKVIAATPGTQASGTDKAAVDLSVSPESASQSLPMTANATMALPHLDLASLPPSALLSYRLSGQEKGIHYQASGELRWQRNDSAYAMNLSVKAFLLGARHWRSVGQINATGLAPSRFSDSWRSERAAHFDRPNQRIVFSNNAPSAPLQSGAQDQVSLYAQLAAAMAQSGQRMQPGTRLQIQTATVRDALPWLLNLEKLETLQMDGKSVQAVKWVCQPRNRFDAQVEFWVSAAHHWLPARIRITQVSGSFIDLQLTGLEALTDLPAMQ